MAKESAGILLWRRSAAGPEVLLVHPGGPFWARKDAGAWSIPKGEIGRGEDPEARARTEFAEELGVAAPAALAKLGAIRQAGGKHVHAFAAEGDFDPAALRSNTFTMEWPPRSGRQKEFAEVDRAEWFDLATARDKINAGQVPLLEVLEKMLSR
jgi:predicted NUDIX family NTP pyrophosphohydrolase